MNQPQGLLLFIPAYRCAPQIVRVLQQLTPELREHFREIVVVDNRSPDNTAEAALQTIQSLAPSSTTLRVVKNPVNMGLGGSHKMAFSYALENNFHGCVILHGDDQGNLQDWAKRLAELKVCQHFVFGARFHPQSQLVNYSPVRIWGNLVFNWLASTITRHRILDLGGSGLNFFPTVLLKTHQFWRYADDLTFHVFLLLEAMRQEQPIEFVPISWREEDQISNVRLFRQARKLLGLLGKRLNPTQILWDEQGQHQRSPGPWERLGS